MFYFPILWLDSRERAKSQYSIMNSLSVGSKTDSTTGVSSTIEEKDVGGVTKSTHKLEEHTTKGQF